MGLGIDEDMDADYYLKAWLREPDAAGGAVAASARRPWGFGMFSIASELDTVFFGCVCPAMLFADVRDLLLPEKVWWESLIVHGSLDSLGLLTVLCFWPIALILPLSSLVRIRNRIQLRQRLGIKGNACGDALSHLCCYPCALVQEHRELASRRDQIIPLPAPLAQPPPPPEEEMA